MNRSPASASRLATQVMQILAAEDVKLQAAYAQTGRNDPCPCGSGRKFKKCHGQKKAAAATAREA
jgi:uncharacterized protein